MKRQYAKPEFTKSAMNLQAVTAAVIMTAAKPG